jgi:hypothetical protein
MRMKEAEAGFANDSSTPKMHRKSSILNNGNSTAIGSRSLTILDQMAGNPRVKFHDDVFYAFFLNMHKMNMLWETHIHISSPDLLNEC